MRIVLFLLLAPTAATIVVGGVTDGNPLAQGLAVGLMAPVCLLVAVLTAPARRPSHKADPAKIARMERELGIGPDASEAPTGRLPMVHYEGTMREAVAIKRSGGWR